MPRGPEPPRLPTPRAASRRPDDQAPDGEAFGAQLMPPHPDYRVGDTVLVRFTGAHPANDLRRGGTYLEVKRANGDRWDRVADDGDWSTTFRWTRHGRAGSTVTITWTIPATAVPGRYRIHYHGNTPGPGRSFTGTSAEFRVRD